MRPIGRLRQFVFLLILKLKNPTGWVLKQDRNENLNRNWLHIHVSGLNSFFFAVDGKITIFLKISFYFKPGSVRIVGRISFLKFWSNLTILFITVPNKIKDCFKKTHRGGSPTPPPPLFNFPVLSKHHLYRRRVLTQSVHGSQINE